MTPDRRIFDRLLPKLPTGAVIDWIEPLPYESIRNYAIRLSKTIDRDDSTLVCGVSFGGVVARELASCLNAKACILISSIGTPVELPPWFRIFRCVTQRSAESAMKRVGTICSIWPRPLRTASTSRLVKFVGKTGRWHRWASAAFLNWSPSDDAERIPLFKVHGDFDSTFPIRYTKADYIIAGGGHVLPLTHCEKVAEILNAIAALPLTSEAHESGKD